MNTYVFQGVMTALTSISHIGNVHGITAKLRREKVVQSDGLVEEVPIISGNSLRGILRDRGMLHMLHTLGYGVNIETGEVRGLSLAAFYFLFSGGALTMDTTRGLDVDEARKWREVIPLVALFGGAMGNRIMPGKVKIGKAIPICLETAHLLPERFVDRIELRSVWDLCQEEAYTRRDDEKSETLRCLIDPPALALLEATAKKKRGKLGTDADVEEAGTKQQMRYFSETLAAGTRFFWEIMLDDVTDVEFGAFVAALMEFRRTPYIGGKSGIGQGKVEIRFDKWIEISPRLKPSGKEIDVPLSNRYMEHLRVNSDAIKGLLDGLA